MKKRWIDTFYTFPKGLWVQYDLHLNGLLVTSNFQRFCSTWNRPDAWEQYEESIFAKIWKCTTCNRLPIDESFLHVERCLQFPRWWKRGCCPSPGNLVELSIYDGVAKNEYSILRDFHKWNCNFGIQCLSSLTFCRWINYNFFLILQAYVSVASAYVWFTGLPDKIKLFSY